MAGSHICQDIFEERSSIIILLAHKDLCLLELDLENPDLDLKHPRYTDSKKKKEHLTQASQDVSRDRQIRVRRRNSDNTTPQGSPDQIGPDRTRSVVALLELVDALLELVEADD